jgi:hypothetical protein
MKHQTAFKYAAIGAAVLIPTLVIAQQRQTQPPGPAVFAPGLVLKAGDILQMRDALADVITRVNTLQANSGGILVKGNMSMYPVEGDSGPIATGGNALAQAFCLDNNDVMVNCGCEGRLNGANQLSFELRRISSTNPVSERSGCTCQGANVGSEGRFLFAVAQCVAVP